MSATGFSRRTGLAHYKEYGANGTITAGDAVKFDGSGEVVAATSGAEVLGVAMNDATSSTNVLIDLVQPDSEWDVVVESGTTAAASVGDLADLNSADGITLTASNNDVLVTGWDSSTTTRAYVVFQNIARAGA